MSITSEPEEDLLKETISTSSIAVEALAKANAAWANTLALRDTLITTQEQKDLYDKNRFMHYESIFLKLAKKIEVKDPEAFVKSVFQAFSKL
jgi:hypothetical protein